MQSKVHHQAQPRLCLVTETWVPEINGVAMTLSRLVRGLLDNGWQVTVLRPVQKDESKQMQHPALTQITVPGLPIPGYSSLRFGLPFTRQLRAAWQKNRPDVVHIATEGPLGWAAVRIAERLRIPVTSSFHTNFHRYCKHYHVAWMRPLVMRHLLTLHNRCVCTMVPNQALKQTLLEDGYKNVEVLGRGIDTELFSSAKRSALLRKQWGLEQNDLAVIYVGRVASEKNLEVLLNAFAGIHNKLPSAKMIWVGDGPQLARLQRQYPQHIFVGAKVGEELAQHYASADLFLFPSMTETFGNVVTEAMASGLAVLAYDYAAPAIHIKHAENGLLVSFGDNEAFVKQASEIVSNLNFIRDLGRQAQQSVLGQGWSNICAVFESHLRLAISNSNTELKANLPLFSRVSTFLQKYR